MTSRLPRPLLAVPPHHYPPWDKIVRGLFPPPLPHFPFQGAALSFCGVGILLYADLSWAGRPVLGSPSTVSARRVVAWAVRRSRASVTGAPRWWAAASTNARSTCASSGRSAAWMPGSCGGREGGRCQRIRDGRHTGEVCTPRVFVVSVSRTRAPSVGNIPLPSSPVFLVQ